MLLQLTAWLGVRPSSHDSLTHHTHNVSSGPDRAPRRSRCRADRQRAFCSAYQSETQLQPRRLQEQSQQRPRLRQASRPASQETGPLLRRCQVVNKPVISCTSGKQLGLVSHFLIDPTQMTVISLAIRPKGFNQSPSGLVSLSTVVQIGDVVLVSTDFVTESPRSAVRRGLQPLNGCEVFTYDGMALGKVRNFSFRPDTGRLAAIQYDELGVPSIPESWVSLYEVGTEHVHQLQANRLTLRRRSELAALMLQDGAIGRLLAGAFNLGKWGAGEEEVQQEDADDAGYRSWAAMHQDAYESFYGRAIPTSRQEYNAFMMGYQAANGAPPPPLPPMGAGGDTSARPQPPLQLPQPRMTYQDRLASQQRQYEYNSVATAPGSRDFRTRSQTLDLPAGPPPVNGSQPFPSYGSQSASQPVNTRPPAWQYSPEELQPQARQPPQQYAAPGRPFAGASASYGSTQSVPQPPGAGQQQQRQQPQQQGSAPAAPRAQQQGSAGQALGWQEGSGWRGSPPGPASRPARSQQAQQAAASSTTASVPLMDVSTVPPHRRRDVDGNYGEAPPRGAAQQSQDGSRAGQPQAGRQSQERAAVKQQAWQTDIP